mgnify:CR=1 FL=1
MADQLDNEATRLTEARQVVKQQAFQMKRALVCGPCQASGRSMWLISRARGAAGPEKLA